MLILKNRGGAAVLAAWVLLPALTLAQQSPVRVLDPFGGFTDENSYPVARGVAPRQPAQDAPVIGFDSSAVRAGPVAVTSTRESVTVQWPDEENRQWTARFSLKSNAPLISVIAVDGTAVVTQAQPYYRVSTGKRRGGWDEFFDFPGGHPEGTRSFHGRFAPKSARATTIGDRLEIAFDGLSLGIFDGSIRYTFFPRSRLIEQAAVVATQQADTAYFYDAGLSLTAASGSAVSYYDTQGVVRDAVSAVPTRQSPAVRYRTIAAPAGAGSVAVFPAPHRYFFPRDFTTNLGYVWHSSRGTVLSLGIRQHQDDGTPFYPWSNAPPGSEQRLSMFLLVQADNPHVALQDVTRFTNQDRFPALDGYKTFTSHWHFAYTVQAMEKGMQWTPPFKPVLQAMGIDSAMIMDFHGDGHPQDTGEIRVRELRAYYAACRAQSGPEFLLIPAEEANVHFGGHWGVAFPKPVYWRMSRAPGRSFREIDPQYGAVYNVADAKELLDLVRKENAFVYQTHARTKASNGFPDAIRGAPQFLDSHYFGAGWKAIPSDLSSPRLGERVFTLLDDMANWGLKKRIVNEVDVFQVDPTHELYAHMNVNYVKLSALPSFENYGRVLDVLRRGDFFMSTGEVLLPEVRIAEDPQRRIAVHARIKNTFPLHLAEIVWGDGVKTYRKIVPLTQTHAFDDIAFSEVVDGGDWKWARFAVWDVAANGAFTNPVWRK